MRPIEMTKQNKYRILCTIEDVFTVQERAEQEGDNYWWNTVHVCKEKGEAGLNEARQWIDERRDE